MSELGKKIERTWDHAVGNDARALPTSATADTVDKLNECLRGELSAVETYEMALKSVKNNELGSVLRQLRDSHDKRVTWLRDYLRSVSAEPSQGSGAWGAFAKVVQAGADLFGESSTMAILEEGEDHGKKLYTDGLDKIDPDARAFIEGELMPEQRRSHDLCRSLDRFVKAA